MQEQPLHSYNTVYAKLDFKGFSPKYPKSKCFNDNKQAVADLVLLFFFLYGEGGGCKNKRGVGVGLGSAACSISSTSRRG